MMEVMRLQKYQKAKGKQVENDLILTCNRSAKIVVEKGIKGVADNDRHHQVQEYFCPGVVSFNRHHGVAAAHKMVWSSILIAT